jgi:hypothetical protein
LVDADVTDADLTYCRIYGVSAWGLKLNDNTRQQNLIITSEKQSKITVDNIEVAQFIYLLLNNEKIRDVIDTITSKAVLILGRFTPERKQVLDALRDELRKRNYLPIVFDFEKSAGRDITETVSLLARMARFVVADITDARSIPQELGDHRARPTIRPCAASVAGRKRRVQYVRALQALFVGSETVPLRISAATDRESRR